MNREHAMQHALLMAQWWMHAATNGHAARRNIWRGHHKLTEDELIADAMETAQHHMSRYRQMADEACSQAVFS